MELDRIRGGKMIVIFDAIQAGWRYSALLIPTLVWFGMDGLKPLAITGRKALKTAFQQAKKTCRIRGIKGTT